MYVQKIKLLDHEKQLLVENKLQNISHSSNSLVLRTKSSIPENNCVNVYRVMGDIEVLFLTNNKILPNTQPYQAIVEGENGRIYMEKYLFGLKYVDTVPTIVVEFTIEKELYNIMFKIQHKPEDCVMSIGLGNKAGKCLEMFNNGIKKFNIVTVKRK